MIIVKTLQWDRCFSFGNVNRLDLNSSNVTQIIGINGSGKSSIPLILEEVLYNKNSKSIKKADIPNRYLNDGYWIFIEFIVDSISYTVDVTRNKSIKVILKRGSEDISSHTATGTYKTIEGLLGMDFKTFTQLVYQNVKSSLQFLTATDTNRKKFLIDLFNLIKYVEFFEVFKAALKDISGDMKILEGEINVIEKWLDSNKLTDTTILESISVPKFPDEEEKSLRSLLVQIENISQKNKKISQNQKYKQLLAAININEINKNNLELEDTKELESDIAQCKAELKIATKDIVTNKNAPDTCRTCGQPIDNSKAMEILEVAECDEFNCKEALKVLQPDLASIKNNNRKKTLIKKTILEWEDLYTKVDNELEEELIQPNDLRDRALELTERIESIKSMINLANEKNIIVVSKNAKIKVIQEQTDEFLKGLGKAEAALKEISKLTSNLEVLKKAFSTNGLVAYKIENLVKELEDLTNKYLAELSDGRFTIEFVISNDKLNVEVTDNGKIIDINALSSGELARVNTGTLLAIRKLMSSISKSKINVLFLDEVISTLDEEGKEKLIEVLLQENELNTFVVSHGWTHPLLEKIEVLKENNISRIE